MNKKIFLILILFVAGGVLALFLAREKLSEGQKQKVPSEPQKLAVDQTYRPLPQDFPVYPNAIELLTTEINAKNFETEDEFIKVSNFYYAALDDAGWELTELAENPASEEQQVFEAERLDKKIRLYFKKDQVRGVTVITLFQF